MKGKKDTLTRQAQDAAARAQRELARATKAISQLVMGDPAAEFEEAFTPPEEEEATEPEERTEARRTWRERLRRKKR